MPRGPEQGGDHYANLAELLPDDILADMGSELFDNYTQYKTSRKDWEDGYTKGLDLLGFKYEIRTQPFQGASGATHPVLAEAITQFQAQAYKELLPAQRSCKNTSRLVRQIVQDKNSLKELKIL